MKATMNNLEANSGQIANSFREFFSEEEISSKMGMLEMYVKASETFGKEDEIEDFINEIVRDVPPRRKTSRSAEMYAEMAERHGEVWDSAKRMYVKF